VKIIPWQIKAKPSHIWDERGWTPTNIKNGNGDLVSLTRYKQAVKEGFLTDYDGHGHPVKDGMLHGSKNIRPSTQRFPKGTTHILWYNK